MAVTSPRASFLGSAVQPVRWDWDNQREVLKQLVRAYENLLAGKIQSTGSVTLTANQATTTLSDRRIGVNSKIFFTATTANAAAEQGGTVFRVSATTKLAATITHVNSGQADRTFDYVVLGV